MSDTTISNFKMFEKAPYKVPDPKASIELMAQGIKEEEKMYGPVFTTKIIKYSVDFLTQKIGEKPPSEIKTLDQLIEYIVSKADKYPKILCPLSYAQVRTENELQGQTGAGTHLETISISKKLTEAVSVKGRNVNLDEVLSKFRQTTIALKVSPHELGYRINGDGSVDVLFTDCPLSDACLKSLEEGWLKRPDGRLRCASGATVCRFFKLLTSYEWDYDRVVAYKPHCVFRCYMI